MPGIELAGIGQDLVRALVLSVYVLAVVLATKPLYHYMRRRGLPHNVAIYYNRKVIHIFAGGVVALLTPLVFHEPVVPLIMALALGALLYTARKTGRLMYWFQTAENAYEVNFTIAWGISVFLLWILTENPKLSVLPALFIAFGDGVTGIVRNTLFARRTKHWAGNLAMLAVVVPIGYFYAGLLGIAAALAATLVERYEFPPIDDNMLIATSSTIILLLPYLKV